MAKKDNKDKFIESAQKFIQKQQFDKAIKEYEKAYESDKKDARIALKLGDLYAKIKKPQDGIKYLRQAGVNYAKDGFYPKAVAVYKQILSIDESNMEVRIEMADLYFKLGLMSDAIINYRTVLDRYEKDGDAAKSLETIRKMVEIEPQNANMRVKLAEFYFKNSQREQGYTEFRRAAEDLRKAQRWDDLIKLYEKLTKADPTNPENYHGYGDALLERGELEKCFQAFHQLLKYRPDDTEAMEKLVVASIRLKDTQNAVSYLKKLASIAEGRGDKAAANTYLQRVLKYHPADEEVLAKLGKAKAPPKKAAPPLPPPKEKAPPPPPPPPPKGKAATPSPPPPPRSFQPLELEGEDEDKIEALPEADEDTDLEAQAGSAGTVEADSALIQPPEEELEPPTADQVPGMLTEADVYLKYGLIDKAQQYLSRILAAFPDHHEAIRLEAHVEKENGRLKQAVQGLIKAAQIARKKNAVNDAKIYTEEALGLDPANTQAQSLMVELDSGVEISLGVEEEGQAPAESFAPEPALDTDILTIEGEEAEGQIPQQVEKFLAPKKPSLDIAQDEPFSFVEEKGDEHLLLAEEEPAPAPPRNSAPPKPSAEPVLELEGEDLTQTVEPEAPLPEPIMEFKEEEPVAVAEEPVAAEVAAPALEFAEEAPLEFSYEPVAEAIPESPLIEVEQEAIGEFVEEEHVAEPVAAPTPPPSPPPPKAAPPPIKEAAPAPQPTADPSPKTVPTPPKKVVLARIQLDMEEADFYIAQGLVGEGRKIYNKILDAMPDYAPAIEKLKSLDQATAATKASDPPIFEEIEEEVEVEEDIEEVPSVTSAVEAAEEALGKTFQEEEKEIPSEALEEVALQDQPPAQLQTPEPLDEAEPEPAKAAAPAEEEAEEFTEVEVEEEEISAEAPDEIALETQPPETPEASEALEEAESEMEISAEAPEEAAPAPEESPEVEAAQEQMVEIEEEELPAPSALAPEILSPKEAETDTIEEPVKAGPSGLDLDDEWEEEELPAETAETGEEEAPAPEPTPPAGIEAVADAAEEAWGEALEPEHEDAPQGPTAEEAHPEIAGVADAAEEAFGAAFGEAEEAGAGKGSFDLSSVLDEETKAKETAQAASQQAETGGADDIGSIIQTFREHVHSQIGHDATAHFDLGIAYKEMGLLDEAINSFRTALESGANASQCLHLIGLCFIDQGELSKAESVFREGLTEKTLADHELVTLKYELGAVLEEQGRLNDALEAFRDVAKVNDRFRDVDVAIIRLEERIGVRAAPAQKKISYI